MLSEKSQIIGIDVLLDSIHDLSVSKSDPLGSASQFTSFLSLIKQLDFRGVSESDRSILHLALLLKGSEINEVLANNNLPKLTIFRNDIARFLDICFEPPRPMSVEPWTS